MAAMVAVVVRRRRAKRKKRVVMVMLGLMVKVVMTKKAAKVLPLALLPHAGGALLLQEAQPVLASPLFALMPTAW